ncbi:hypothetical protein Nepgr_004452 [Nepenthes gracilis]|uniref:Uncharacterized protein n=1 Tax=Nepenthes gracilis TaxID=150966 RepID=A0AAD3S1H1_NEPGR|nr:hypothetical protein Nepgr_004452 [Nepenthes gracilis]
MRRRSTLPTTTTNGDAHNSPANPSARGRLGVAYNAQQSSRHHKATIDTLEEMGSDSRHSASYCAVRHTPPEIKFSNQCPNLTSTAFFRLRDKKSSVSLQHSTPHTKMVNTRVQASTLARDIAAHDDNPSIGSSVKKRP